MTGDPKTPQAEKTMHTLAGGSDFPTTRWTLVIAAADPRRTEARSALVSLCEAYWYPLYAYVRRRGYPPDQAQDLTQDFFIRVLEGRYLDRADPDKGRLPSFGIWPQRWHRDSAEASEALTSRLYALSILYYNADTGAGAVGTLDPSTGTHNTLKVYAPGAFALGFTQIVSTPGGIFYYNGTTGAGAIGKLDGAGNHTTLKLFPAGAFTTGFTRIVSTPNGILFYNGQTGAGAVGRIQ